MSEKKARLSVEISPELNERLLALARRGGWPLSWVIRRALKEYLDRAERQGKIEVPAA